ncbi:flavin-dependent oxidoreductase [Actinocorallia longicatena]|uniref:Flavin-dependent oxidoreductase n=1 Tax=Actinocorallia longicatena TaxID=111803 RepID=A0ABP6QIG0_9ACTN
MIRGDGLKVMVAGGGIGGLTTALSLHAAGVEVEVIEGAGRLLPLGVGINLQPHAVRELTELGLGDALARIAVPAAEMAHFDRHGNLIWAEPRGTAAGYLWPQYSVHRGELQMLLAEAVRERLGSGALRLGTRVTGFEQHEDGVEVSLGGDAGVLRADVLVGADGLHSTVRALLHPDGPPLRWNGVRMWRGLTLADPFLTGATVAVAGSNAAAKFVAYPVSPVAGADGRVPVNWVAEAKVSDVGAAGEGLGTVPDWTRGGSLDDALPHFEGWVFPWLDVPALMASTETVLEYPMVDRDPLPSWTSGRVTLLGDAAHPMYPVGSNGGSQAIIDARVLAHELATTGDPGKALLSYESLRREATSSIVLACREMPADRLLQTVATRAPDGFTAIETVLSAEELAEITSAYTRTTGADTLTLNERRSWTPAR